MADTTLQSWEYLETLPGTQFYRLYRSPSSALAIFRKRLSALAKSFVMMLLYMPRPMSVKQLELFVKEGSRGEREYALDLLHRYHIFRDVTFDSTKAYALTPDFAKSLRRALTGAGDNRSFGQLAKVPERDRVSISELDEYSRQRWEGILGYMVGSSAIPLLENEQSAAIDPAPGVIELLKAGHLIEVSGTYSRGGTAKITKEGFAFVLQDINTQVWALLFLYVDNAELLEMDKVDVLSFLFLVSSLELGVTYSTSTLDDTQHRILSDLVSLGLVYQPAIDDEGTPANYFYPTRLATTLTSDSATTLSATNTQVGTSLSQPSTNTSTANSTGTQKGFIIVETNYRVYAYTSSPLQIALLSLFINLRSRHPNLVTGKMSKSSVQRAVQAGITAEQIISYLTSHAHPQMRRHAAAEQAALQARGIQTSEQIARAVPILPATILDQIHLWQLERDRMTTTPGFLFRDFSTHAEYEGVVKYADETGVLVWKDDGKRLFFVTRLEGVRGYLAERRNAANG
ncbi:RNA polymerase II transcription factor B subunit 2 [Cladophialophora carrionii]|uniref:RNA polymerase II transcription factor B subunit 2 n=1 Tax=Cladophialophora carrionii TaxID=86049 RepID=A0A1C1CGA6_9EURO|nr:RNA polymerase II transcription factor B subunit 2 [Cladophialophora carrionii]